MSNAVVDSSPAPTDRMQWMDVLRGIAVVLVVLAHVGLIVEYQSARFFPGLEEAIGILTPLRMPMLFLLSGLLVPRSLAKGPWPYTRGKLRAIVYPYVLWTILLGFLAMAIAQEGAFPDLIGQLLRPTTHLWFLGFLIIFYAVALLCRWINPLVFVVVAIALIILPADTSWDALWLRSISFFLGVALGRELPAFERVLEDRVLCAVLAVASTALMVASVVWSWRDLDVLWQSVIALMFFTGVAGLVVPIAGSRALWPLRWVGRRTVILYILHWTFAEVTARLLVAAGLGAVPVLLLTMVAAFVPPIIVMVLADRFRLVAWFFEWNPRQR